MYYSKLFLFVFLMLACYDLKAQDNYYLEDEHTFRGALIAGANFTQVDGDTYYGYNKTGMNLGGAVYIKVGESMALSMELLYVQKGSKGKPLSTSTISIQKYDINLNYAEVPLQLYYFDRHKHHFGGGFSYARLISSKENMVTTPVIPVVDGQYPFRKSDVNFLITGNFHIKKGFFIGARFQYSLMPIRKNNTPPNLGRPEQFNNVWNIRLMYMF